MRGKLFGIWMLLGLLLSSEAAGAGRELVEVPFKLYRGYAIVVQGSVGPLEKLNLLVDTGAVPSVIDQRIAKRLKLAGKVERLAVFSQDVQARQVRLTELRVGPVVATSVAALVQDLSFIEQGLGTHVDAMIGFDVLGRSSFSIDYEAEKLVFGPVEPSESPYALQVGPGFVYLTLRVQGRPIYLVVDTGSKDLILFASRVRDRLNGLRARGTKTSSNLGGEVKLRQVNLPEARLGSTPLGPLDAFLLDSPGQGTLGFDGLLGVRSLGLTRLSFDFERQTICWR
jgi:predicted aspartyl protease